MNPDRYAEQERPVLIRVGDARFHTTLHCHFAAMGAWGGGLIDERVDSLTVSPVRSAIDRGKVPCKTQECKGQPYYWWGDV